VDNIFEATPFWFWLTKQGRRREEAGGRWIGVPLMYGKNQTVQSLGKGDTISIADTDHLTTAVFDWKYVAGTIVRYRFDDDMNRGKAAIMNLVQSKLENLRLSLIDKLEEMAFGDGTGNGGKDIDGLQLLVKSDGTGTVGGINASTYSWWQNKYKSATGAFSVYGVDDMRNLYNSCSKGNDAPDFIITDQDSYELYERESLEYMQIVNEEVADLSFGGLRFKGATIMWSPSCPSGYMYFLNSRYLEWVAMQGVNFVMTPWKEIPNQLDKVAQVVVSGNLVVSNRSRQGVLTGISA